MFDINSPPTSSGMRKIEMSEAKRTVLWVLILMVMPILSWLKIIPSVYDFFDLSHAAPRGLITSSLWNLFGGLIWGVFALVVSVVFLTFYEWVASWHEDGVEP